MERKSDDALFEQVMKMYDDLQILHEFGNFLKRESEQFTQLLKESTDDIPKKTWKAVFLFVQKVYSDFGGYWL